MSYGIKVQLELYSRGIFHGGLSIGNLEMIVKRVGVDVHLRRARRRIRIFGLKGVSAVIAVLLMIAIAVIAALIAYFWVMGYFRTTSSKVSKAIQIPSAYYTGPNQYLCVYVQNAGQGKATLAEGQCLYVDGRLEVLAHVNPGGLHETSYTLQETETVIIVDQVNLTLGQTIKIKVVTTEGTFVEKYLAINNFAGQNPYSLSVIVDPPAGGTVALNDSGPYDYGDVVQLTSNAATGWTFSGWSQDLSGSSNPATITIDTVKTVTATFAQIDYVLTLNEVGSGSISKLPDQASYHYGDSVQLTATANIGWTFSEWSGDLTGTTNPASIPIDETPEVTATFTQNDYVLIINTVGSGSVSKNPDLASYHYDDSVQLTAIAANGWTFAGWGGDLGGSTNPVSLIIDETPTVAATFTQDEYTLTINVSPLGSGDVAINQSAPFHYGDLVLLTANANVGWTFSSWGNDLTGSVNPSAIFIDGSKTVTATFTQNVYALAVSVNPLGSGSVSFNNTGPYHYGDWVQLTAVPASGWSFSTWSGDLGGGNNPENIFIDGDKSVNAAFTQQTRVIHASSGLHGSISPSGDVTVSYGGDQDFTFMPDLGYRVADVVVDFVSHGSSSYYNFTNIIVDHTISVSFELVPRTITASAGAGGSISPSGQVSVSYGGSQTFTIAANAGYSISDVLVDGVSQGAIGSFTFSNVTADHTISATFALSASKLVYTTGASQSLTIGQVSSVIIVQRQDLNSNPVTGGGTIIVSLVTSAPITGRFYSDAGGTTQITWVQILSGQSSASFYYSDTAAGTRILTASSGSLTPATTTFTINSYKLVYRDGAGQTLFTGQVSSPIRLRRQNPDGSSYSPSVGILVQLTSTSSTGRFYANPDGTGQITQISISSGSSSSSNFYYVDTSAGTPTLTASSSGYTPATTVFTIQVPKANPDIESSFTPHSGIQPGNQVTDTAKLVNATADAGGSFTYRLYSGVYPSGTLIDSDTKTVTNGVVLDSKAFTVPTQGPYYFISEYSGDTNNNGITSYSPESFIAWPSAQTVILRPSADTSDNHLGTYPASTPHYQCVNQSSPDGDTSYVYAITTNYWTDDTYQLPNLAFTSGTINYVTIHAVARTTGYGSTQLSLTTHGSEYDGTDNSGYPFPLTANWLEYTAVWSANPYTGTTWTIQEINDLLVGCSLYENSGDARCTQVYVEVYYTPAVSITITSNPSGGGFVIVDGNAITTPATFNWAIGSTHSLQANSPVSGVTGIRYVYTGWDDGGAQTHNYIVPSSSATITANFKTQYRLYVTSAHDSPNPTVGDNWYDPGTSVTASVTTPADQSGGIRYRCTGWTGTGNVPSSGSGTSVTFTITSGSTLTWNWVTQYRLTVISAHDSPNLAGDNWYDTGTSVTASVTSPVDESGTRYRCTGWSGTGSVPSSGSSSSVTFTVTASSSITWNWIAQYQVTFAVNPTGTGTTTPTIGTNWCDAGSNSITATANTGYTFSSWSATGSITITTPSSASTTATVNGPGTITASFIVTPILDHFTFDTITSPKTAGTAFSLTIRAIDENGNALTSYTGTNTLSVSSGTMTPTSTGAFSSGVWTGQVTLYTSGTGITIGTTGATKTGTSNGITVTAGSGIFGYQTLGSNTNNGNLEDYILGSIYTSPSYAVTAQSITAYIQVTGTHTIKAAIYTLSGSTGTLVRETQEVSVTTSNDGWITFAFASGNQPTLTANTDYLLVVWANSASGSATLYSTSSGGAGRYNSETYTTHYPSPTTFSSSTVGSYRYSIYCTYSIP